MIETCEYDERLTHRTAESQDGGEEARSEGQG